MTEVVISGTGLYTPPYAISNDELVAAFNAWVRQSNDDNRQAIAAGEVEPLPESNSEFIEKASGIRSRYVVDRDGILDPERLAPRIPERDNDTPSVQCEMALAAAEFALVDAGLEASDIDFVIVACSNMQRPYPAMAVEIQHFLGIQGFGYDMNVACSSATFGIQAAVNAIHAGSAKRVLMVNPEICSGHLNFRDRDSHFIFGDACTAVVLEEGSIARSERQYRVLGTQLWTQFSNNIRNNFGFLNRGDENGIGKLDKLFVQNGRKVFKEVCPQVARHISGHLDALNVPVSALKRMWLHQANLNMNQLVARRVLGREPGTSEAPVILDEYANTSSAGSIIAFHKYRRDLEAGDKGIICSFGAGYSIGSVILETC
ncbi:beta-ketoacyl-ACP synthase III [Kistimonas asteriae]|uniref:beta-ketoacyl-ACP synthase III n=1 Tax=Kistimonas asteriae TaxID=517724 RepID=UPI001BA8D075